MNRAIFHVEMDAFFASVEQRDADGTRNLPLRKMARLDL
jgi:nucleotidyltransferase/DNA polymerase involved in DNA repair